MSVNTLAGLQHRPEVVVAFLRRMIDRYRQHDDSERRAQVRQAIAIPVSVQPLDSNFQSAGDVFDTVTKDISTGGIGMIHGEPLDARFLQIKIAAPDGDEMRLLAQVKHCTRRGQHYQIGARFVVDWSSWRGNKPQENSVRTTSADDTQVASDSLRDRG